ncbi:hypothetical protein ACFVGX_22675 [Streptomyces sp. NPDC127113]|uniref:hypothetical protein n=1 Tax=Streptomyces sp. NPDC127113 TaxID=3345365 RepID=UPI00363A2F5C
MPQMFKLPRARAGAVVAAATVALAGGLAASPASAASSGYVYSSGKGAEGSYYYGSERVYACDIKTDGYKAVTQVFSRDDRLLVTVTDTYNNGSCSWKKPTLFEGTHKIRACVQKGSAKPTKCGPKRSWYVD